MTREKRAERLQIMLTREEVRALEAWRFQNKMPSKSAAARALMNLGLRDSVSDPARQALLSGDVTSGDVSLVRRDAGVTGRELRERPDSQVLVVDADSLAARGIAWILREEGYAPLPPAASIGQAESLLEESPSPVAAVTDVRLGSETVEPLLERLTALRVPFLFCTTQSVKSVLPERLWSVPVISKISAPSALPKALTSLIHGHPVKSA